MRILPLSYWCLIPQLNIFKEIMDDRFKNAIKRPADLAIANDGTTFIVSVTESKFHILKLDGAHTKTNAQING